MHRTLLFGDLSIAFVRMGLLVKVLSKRIFAPIGELYAGILIA